MFVRTKKLKEFAHLMKDTFLGLFQSQEVLILEIKDLNERIDKLEDYIKRLGKTYGR